MLKKILILFVAMLNTLLAMAEYDNQPDSDNYERAYEAVNNGDHEKVIEIMTLELQNNPENSLSMGMDNEFLRKLGRV